MLTAKQASQIALEFRIKEENNRIGKYLNNVLRYILNAATKGQFSVDTRMPDFPDLDFWHSDRGVIRLDCWIYF